MSWIGFAAAAAALLYGAAGTVLAAAWALAGWIEEDQWPGPGELLRVLLFWPLALLALWRDAR